MKFYKQSFTVKTEANEDAVAIHTNSAYLSDGAGGSGSYCGKWADYLVNQFCDTIPGSIEELNKILFDIHKPFVSEIESIRGIDLGSLSKFRLEGSYATLSGIKVISEKQLSFFTFGDSPIFHFGKGKLNLYCAHKRLIDFTENPNLLNWRGPVKNSDGFFIQKDIRIEKGDRFMITSDALGQLVWMSQLIFETQQGNRASQEELKEVMKDVSKLSNCILRSINHLAKANQNSEFLDLWNKVRPISKHLSSRKKKKKEKLIMRKFKISETLFLIPRTLSKLTNEFWRMATDNKLFEKNCTQWCNEGFLLKDDYSMILLEFK